MGYGTLCVLFPAASESLQAMLLSTIDSVGDGSGTSKKMRVANGPALDRSAGSTVNTSDRKR